jgi:hypothetical protein
MNHPTSLVIKMGPPDHNLPPSPIQPHQVWGSLAPAHQQLLFRTIVTICRTLLSAPSGAPNRKEARDDEACPAHVH